MTITKLSRPAESAFNPGEIVEIDGWPRWQTKACDCEVALDIVSSKSSGLGEIELGIASFVVMEQPQPFLHLVSHLMADSIAAHTLGERVFLVTAESKGSHLAPRVWSNLADIVRRRLEVRIITLRKGSKVYMKRPAVFGGREFAPPQISFHSITSNDEQSIVISPRDTEFLLEATGGGAKPVIVDDFIGRGGTIWAISQVFQQLRQPPPRVVAVVGADGDLYEQTFAREGIDVTLLPQPFPLKLPTFIREKREDGVPAGPWRVNA